MYVNFYTMFQVCQCKSVKETFEVSYREQLAMYLSFFLSLSLSFFYSPYVCLSRSLSISVTAILSLSLCMSLSLYLLLSVCLSVCLLLSVSVTLTAVAAEILYRFKILSLCLSLYHTLQCYIRSEIGPYPR